MNAAINLKNKLEPIISKYNYTNYKWIDPKQIIVSNWVRMKCRYGCEEYGKTATCPPNAPEVSECRQFFEDYNTAILFHFEKSVAKPEDRRLWSRNVNLNLLKLERDIFLSGFHKAFLLFMDSCPICTECVGEKELCKNPEQARPSPEGMAIDVFTTVRQYGYPIQVLSEYSQAMNRYAFLLVE